MTIYDYLLLPLVLCLTTAWLMSDGAKELTDKLRIWTYYAYTTSALIIIFVWAKTVFTPQSDFVVIAISSLVCLGLLCGLFIKARREAKK